MSPVDQRVDAVFEGGGVKGIALVGATAVVEATGYRFANLAGTSAGAIVAALLGAGYTAPSCGQSSWTSTSRRSRTPRRS
jgi:predicted acylesterase/phospholipase RssA